MRAGRQSDSRLWGAIIAAYLLVLQSLFGAYAGGAAPLTDPALLPAAAICPADGHGGSSGPDHQPVHHHQPDCCLVGCAMMAPLSPGAPVLLPLPSVHSFHGAILTAFARLAPARRSHPANPRAPPIQG